MIQWSLVKDHRDALWDAKGASVMTSLNAASRFPTKGSTVTGPVKKPPSEWGHVAQGFSPR